MVCFEMESAKKKQKKKQKNKKEDMEAKWISVYTFS